MNKNAKVLSDFVEYCRAHPEYRFWQALRNWSHHNYVIVSPVLPTDAEFESSWRDTFNWEGK